MRLSLSPLSLLPLLVLDLTSAKYTNTAITRNYELGGSITSLTTTYNVKFTREDETLGAEDYELVIGGDGEGESAWWEVNVGGKKLEGLSVSGGNVSGSYPTIPIPASLLSLKTSPASPSTSETTITLIQSLAHHTRPLPTEISQDDPQYLVFERNGVMVETGYETVKMNVKYRAPGKILSHSTPPDAYTRDQSHKKVGSMLTFGPYHNVPPTASISSAPSTGLTANTPVMIHYPLEEPVLAVKELKRWAEVSHWGGNLNLEDKIKLRNDGASLKGHFSRLLFQMAKFRPTYPAQILRSITLALPAGAHDPYFYDVIGNVSTSNFRPSNPIRGGNALLELKPRYPMLGGWEYAFTVGWDNPLKSYLKKREGGQGEMVLRVPFLTGLRDVVVEEAVVVIVLPEGAHDVQVHTPFPVDSITHSVHKTYLDTIGRPKITLKKSSCTEKHEQDVYITYTYPAWAAWQKPLTVAAVCASLFTLAGLVKRLDMGISRVPVAHVKVKTVKID